MAADPLAERVEDARSRPVGTGRTGEHTRGREAVSPAFGPIHSRRNRGSPARCGADDRSVHPRLAAVLLLVLLAAPPPAPATAAPAPPPGQVPLWTAPLAGPLPVGRRFEAPAHAYGPGHRGVDLHGPAGAPVLAAGDGVVAFAGMVAGRPVVSIDHADGLRTTYEPVEPSVGAGQVVARGSPIGVLSPGHAGCSVEACLHWGLRRGQAYLDPLALLRPPRIRLLPIPRPAPRAGPPSSAP